MNFTKVSAESPLREGWEESTRFSSMCLVWQARIFSETTLARELFFLACISVRSPCVPRAFLRVFCGNLAGELRENT